MRPLFASLEKYLLQQAMTFEKEVRAAAKESISPKGKLIRPTLVFAAAAGGALLHAASPAGFGSAAG